MTVLAGALIVATGCTETQTGIARDARNDGAVDEADSGRSGASGDASDPMGVTDAGDAGDTSGAGDASDASDANREPLPDAEVHDDGGRDDSGPTSSDPLTCAPITCGASNGRLIPVGEGDDLQAAIERADPGDTLVLKAGATYTGSFVLRAKGQEGCITLRTSALDADLPAGQRVGPKDVTKLARIVGTGRGLPALRTEASAKGYRLVGLEVMPEAADAEIHELVALGSADASQSSLSDVPSNLLIERCYIHGWPEANFKRGIGLNSASTCVIDSTVLDFHSDFQDSQAIGGFNGPGPFRIINNLLEGAAENIMFGGATPAIHGLIPSDIEIHRNHLHKPLSWRRGDPANRGYVPWVKNAFEIKNGRNVVLRGNVLENVWVGADQHGTAVVLTPRGEGGTAPWATVENVRIEGNIIRHVGGGVGIAGHDDSGPSQRTHHITIAHNIFEDIREDYALDVVRVIQFSGVDDLTIEHNTFHYASPTFEMVRTYGEDSIRFAYRNNVVSYGGGFWSDCGKDATALACRLPSALFAGNIVIGGPAGAFPVGNHFPSDLAGVMFIDFPAGLADYHNYALAPASPFKGRATDGLDPGADVILIDRARGTSLPP